MTAPLSIFDFAIDPDGSVRHESPAGVSAPVLEVPVRAHTRRVRHRGNAAPPPPPPPAGLAEREAERRRLRARDQERLLPIVTALAARRGAEGITASEVITEAVLRGVLTGQETAASQRALSWIGPWLAQLARRDILAPLMRAGMQVRRRSEREASHGNSQNVYVAPQHAGGAHG